MKTIKQLSALLCIISISALITGCGALGTVTKGEPTTVTQPVFSYNPGTGQIVQTGTTSLVTSVDVWTPNTNLVAAIGAAQGVATIGAATPSPAQPIFAVVAAALGVVASGLEILRRKKNNEITTQNAMIAAMITGVETAEDAGLIKKAINANAVANGSQVQLDARVQEIYRQLP